jgi:hypothetical protein
LFLVALSACAKKEPTSPALETAPVLSALTAPTQVYMVGQTVFRISVQVEDDQGLPTVESVRFRIIRMEGAVEVQNGDLKDEGTDGDLVARDGIFSADLSSDFAGTTAGTFEISVLATDVSGNQSNTLRASISVLSGAADGSPALMNASAPTTIFVNPDFEFLLSVSAAHPDGLLNIKRVYYEYTPPTKPNPTLFGDLYDDGTHGDQVASDGTYTVALGSRLFPKTSGYYLRLLAEDVAGNLSNPLVVKVSGRSERAFEPLLSGLSAPNIVILDTLRSTIKFSLRIDDPQGLNDLSFVRFSVDLPDGSRAGHFEMADDGNIAISGDAAGGDGIFTGLYNLPIMPGEFRFVFQAKDQNDYLSNKIEHFIPATQLESPVVTNFLSPGLIVITDDQDETIAVSVDVSDPQGIGDIASVQYRLLNSAGEEVNGGPFAMFDDGMAASTGDSTAGDGRFSALVTFDGLSTAGGDHTFIFSARDQKDSSSNDLTRTLTVAFNHSPVLSNLVAPDSAETHPTQTKQFLLSVDVFDQEGLEDVELVRFRSFLPSVNGQPQQEAQNSPTEMFDDGDFFVNGDQIEADGIFSRIINLPAQNEVPVQEGDFKFVFEAWDKSGRVSNRIEHFVNVKNGTGVD